MIQPKLQFQSLSRRGVLRIALGGAVGIATSPAIAAFGPRGDLDSRRLSFRHLHTGEQLSVIYREGVRYDPGALGQLDVLLRDFRTGEKTRMDVDLFEFLYQLKNALETDQPFEIISGYRSPKTNARLAAQGSGVAKRSYHMRGMAIDVRVPGRSLRHVRKAALSLRLGGVGYYGRSNFVHLDTGRIRFW